MTRPLARTSEGRHHWRMIGAAFLVTTLKYLVLVACAASWAYAAYHGTRFEMRLTTKDLHAVETLNHPATLFRHDLSKRALESRQKTFRGLAVFFALAVCLLVILCFDQSGPPTSPFLYHDAPTAAANGGR